MRRIFHRNLHFQTFYYHNLYKIAYYHLQNHILKPLIQFFLHYFSLLEQLHDKSVVKPQVVKEQVQEDQTVGRTARFGHCLFRNRHMRKGDPGDRAAPRGW